jgi:trans-2,3-dihydro-3-hydroxyanthranilate isomerase
MSRRFAIVDVFARQKYAGNQLGVVTDAADLDTGEMQAIAAEIDYSETTFVTGEPAGDGWPVRIFTPTEEVPFAGHPTLGTAAVIRDQLADGQPDSVTLDLQVGQIPVDVRERDGRETLWMDQNDPEFGDQFAPEAVADVLGLDPSQIDSANPVQAVSTGLPAIVVPLVDREALEAIDLDRRAYDDLVANRDEKLVHAFCADPREADHDIAARMFAPYYGVPEAPATGSATGGLAAYLPRHEYFGSSAVEAQVEQGYEMGRPSVLYLEADRTDGGTIDVEVGGSVVPVARGELL